MSTGITSMAQRDGRLTEDWPGFLPPLEDDHMVEIWPSAGTRRHAANASTGRESRPEYSLETRLKWAWARSGCRVAAEQRSTVSDVHG